ncbi:hypothetical protein PROVRUST_07391 [Providencia rustigianii DSM 4541]|uniref:Uncharacterized protein n=1 Tax=Providencia rustigianii DSM 4541 TaxID=500637 RepID=D1P586_9GAMM|nr:hypothetical protein PROVRUST_07391 [Providencia rustigianii DSM 4541]
MRQIGASKRNVPVAKAKCSGIIKGTIDEWNHPTTLLWFFLLLIQFV